MGFTRVQARSAVIRRASDARKLPRNPSTKLDIFIGSESSSRVLLLGSSCTGLRVNSISRVDPVLTTRTGPHRTAATLQTSLRPSCLRDPLCQRYTTSTPPMSELSSESHLSHDFKYITSSRELRPSAIWQFRFWVFMVSAGFRVAGNLETRRLGSN